MEIFDIFYDNLVYFVVICKFFLYFAAICDIFPNFGTLHQEKSGNPGLKASRRPGPNDKKV
jgi:hypothetical protein